MQKFGKLDLLAWMNKYWVNQGAPNSDFWGHEFSKHATCYSTFDVPCYGPEYVEHEEVVDFFETAIKYYRRLPTWSWLKEASIVPSNTTTYSLSAIQGQLTKKYGAVPYVGCSGPRYNDTEQGIKDNSTDTGRTVLSEAWYYMHVSQLVAQLHFLSRWYGLLIDFTIQAYGRPQDGNTVAVNATTPNTSCAKAKGAIHYYKPAAGSLQSPSKI